MALDERLRRLCNLRYGRLGSLRYASAVASSPETVGHTQSQRRTSGGVVAGRDPVYGGLTGHGQPVLS